MPRFRKGAATSPLLPAHDASSLGLSKKRAPSSTWASLGEAGLAFFIAVTLFAAIIYFLVSIDARRSAALDSRPSEELPGTVVPTQNTVLKQKLDALIEEASKIAKEQGILTEVDAAENTRLRASNKEEDWSWVLDDKDDSHAQRSNEQVESTGQCSAGAANSTECGPHGECISNQCSCAVAFSGTFCGHSVLLSHPYTPEGVSVGQLGYEGDFLLLRDSKIQQQTEDLEQEENKIQAVRHLLPLSDPIFKGKIFESCAVVGDGGSLLLRHYGSVIDSHSLIFRVTGTDLSLALSNSTSHQNKDEKEYVGTKSGVYLVNTLPKKQEWENLGGNVGESIDETATGKELLSLVLAPPFPENLERVQSYSAAENQSRLPHLLHPRFVQHVLTAFGTSIGPENRTNNTVQEAEEEKEKEDVALLEKTAVMLALNTCRSISLYGLISLPDLPTTYYTTCSSQNLQPQEKEQRDSWRVTLENYFKAGLLKFGEPCILECVGDSDSTIRDNKCDICRKEHNIDVEALKAAMKAMLLITKFDT